MRSKRVKQTAQWAVCSVSGGALQRVAVVSRSETESRHPLQEMQQAPETVPVLFRPHNVAGARAAICATPGYASPDPRHARVRKWQSAPHGGTKTGLRTWKAAPGRVVDGVFPGRGIRRKQSRVRKSRFLPRRGTKAGLRTRMSRMTVMRLIPSAVSSACFVLPATQNSRQ